MNSVAKFIQKSQSHSVSEANWYVRRVVAYTHTHNIRMWSLVAILVPSTVIAHKNPKHQDCKEIETRPYPFICHSKIYKMNYQNEQKHHLVAIIGAGVAGVAAAGALQDYGIDFVVFDKQSRPGGLWADNYPGAKGTSCDDSA